MKIYIPWFFSFDKRLDSRFAQIFMDQILWSGFKVLGVSLPFLLY